MVPWLLLLAPLVPAMAAAIAAWAARCGGGYSWWMEVASTLWLRAPFKPGVLGEVPFCDSIEGAGLRLTEPACEIKWVRVGRVSVTAADAEATAAWAAADRARGQGCGDNGTAGLVGVMRGGRGVSGLLGGNPGAVSRISICKMLWITSPAPAHLSARSALLRRQRALPTGG